MTIAGGWLPKKHNPASQPPAADAAMPLRGVRRPIGSVKPARRLFCKLTDHMQPCPIFPVIGTITAIGPNNPDKGGVLYRYIEISEKGDRTRCLTIVRAAEALAALIEQHAIGMFLFWERQGERWLWCVDRADGPQQVDFETLRAYFQQGGCGNAPA